MTEIRTVRGIEIAIDRHVPTRGGEAALVVFIHGVGANRTAWRQQLDLFADAGFEAVAIDMRGTGKSQARSADGLLLPISIEEFALDVDALIAVLGFEKAHWVGNSMGGVIIQHALAGSMNCVDKAVLCNTFAHHPLSAELLPRPAKALQQKSLSQFAAERIPTAFATKISDEEMAEAITAMAEKDVEAYLASWAATWSPDFRSSLERMDRPALVITGSEDTITPPALGREIANGIPNSRYYEIAGAGHISNIDHPEIFNRVVLDFLQSN